MSGVAAGGRQQLARRAGVVSAAVLSSRVFGLVREQVFAIYFGASRELDAFVTAFRIPNLLRDLFAEGALSAAFVTTFTQELTRRGEDAAWRLANLVVSALTLIVGVLCIGGIVAAPAITHAIAPGFAAIPGKTALTVHLARIMFPFLLLVALAAVAMGILNTRNRFGVPAAASAFFNIGSVVGGLVCAWWLAPQYVTGLSTSLGDLAPDARSTLAERAITGMAVGTLIGGLCQLAVQLPSLWRVGFRYRPVVSLSDPGVRQVLRLMAPATIGAAAVQVNVFVNSNFASYLGNGPVSWLNVAFRFMQLPIGLFGVAVGTVALPALSRQVAQDDASALRTTLRQALELIALFCIPAAVGLAQLGVPVIGLIYQHGRFGPADTAAAAQALAAYAVGLAGYAGIKVLAPAFYALNDARTPMLVSLVSIAVNLVFNWALVRGLGLGHVGLALSTSVVALGNCLLLYVFLRRRVGPLGGRLGGTLARICASAGAMGGAGIALDAALRPHLPAGPIGRYAVQVAVEVPLLALVFAGACVAFGVQLPGLA
ncbi:MAG: murein biosynthesis integral membrane protein MurJ, partial [Candidatus Binatia bacterium]